MGPSSPPQKKNSGGAQPTIFGPCLLWPNGWMDQDATWYGGIGLFLGDIVLDGAQLDPTPSHKKRHAPNFRPMSIVAKRSLISAILLRSCF